MKKVDYHMHTYFSADSEEQPENHIETAIKLGFDEICFTEHRDFDYPGLAFDLDVDAYYTKIKSLQAQYGKKIKIKWGLEIGLDLNYRSAIAAFVEQAPFDFVIGSIHVINHEEFFETTSFFDHKTKLEAYQIYFDEALKCVKMFDCFESLGHLDYIVRYATYDNNFVDLPSSLQSTLDEILKVLVQKNKALEVNTRLFNDPRTIDFYGYLLDQYRAFGGRLVTLGTDSHIAKRDEKALDSAFELIQQKGFSACACYTKRQLDDF